MNHPGASTDRRQELGEFLRRERIEGRKAFGRYIDLQTGRRIEMAREMADRARQRTILQHLSPPERQEDETPMDTPMLDPSWTPAAGYGHAQALMPDL